jgi:predicted DCC family thiol-disulfide oxidoreductase YuxK
MAAQPTIILFDGLCNLCGGVVQFIIKRDPHARFRFASLQSDAARRLCAQHHYALPDTTNPNAGDSASNDTIVVIANNRALERSDAALAIAAQLTFPWPLLRVLRVLPRAWRDAIYRFVARNRVRWFGKRATCMIPTYDIRARFLD